MDLSLLKDVSILYAFIFAGFIIGKLLKGRLNRTRTTLTKILINLISPIQIFTVLTTNTTQLDFWFVFQIIIVMFAVFTVNSTSILYYLKNKEWVTDPQRGTHFLNVAFPNVMFFTIPLILTLFSEELTVVSVFYASSALVLRGSIGIMICEKYSREQKEEITKKQMVINLLKSLFTFMPFLAILAAVIVLATGQTQIGDAIFPLKGIVNEIASDTSLILVGMVLAGLKIQEVKEYKKHIFLVAFWRIIISFLVYISIAYFLEFSVYDKEVKRILLIIVCGPPAVFNVIFSIYFKLDEKFAAIAVATITLIVLILLPAFLALGEILFV